jgi:DNA-binding NarL/FixJ family response regulator
MDKKRLSILIVDDNLNFVRRMIALLNEVDDIYAIHTAHNYDEAFILLDKKPDLTLLDIHLPGKNGMDILKRLKSSAKDYNVIMLTNQTDQYYREQCEKLGASFFLDKTNDFELVPVRIKEFAVQNNRSTCSC